MESSSPAGPLPAEGTVRLVLLGASNLARGLPTALVTARAVAARNHPGLPVRIFVATGRGRSFGNPSAFFGRVLPGILESGLWQALEDAPDGPTYGLITDIGNDVAYGVEPETILRWIETCQKRFEPCVRTVVTSLPLENLERYPLSFLEVFRKALFPSSELGIEEMLVRAETLDARLEMFCDEYDLVRIEQPASWFGLDPIHHRHALRREIWSAIFAPWQDFLEPPAARTRKLFHFRAQPERFTFLGRDLCKSQPCVHLRDGTSVSLF